MTEKENVFTHAAPTMVGDHSSPSSIDRDHDPKGATAFVGETSDFDADSDITPPDPFVPFDDLPDERKRIVTIRAVILGAICGALVGSSNIYLGLKTGWTFGASLFGAIIGFAVLKSLSKALPETFPILGGSFGKCKAVAKSFIQQVVGRDDSVFTTRDGSTWLMHHRSPREQHRTDCRNSRRWLEQCLHLCYSCHVPVETLERRPNQGFRTPDHFDNRGRLLRVRICNSSAQVLHHLRGS